MKAAIDSLSSQVERLKQERNSLNEALVNTDSHRRALVNESLEEALAHAEKVDEELRLSLQEQRMLREQLRESAAQKVDPRTFFAERLIETLSYGHLRSRFPKSCKPLGQKWRPCKSGRQRLHADYSFATSLDVLTSMFVANYPTTRGGLAAQ